MNLDLHTERLRLRSLAPDDLDLAVALLTDPEIMKFVGDTLTTAQVDHEHELSIRRCGGGAIGIWCILDRASEERLGTVLLLPMPIDEDDTNWDLVAGGDLPDCEIEIGFLFRRTAWGKGYATEAARRLLTFAFDRDLTRRHRHGYRHRQHRVSPGARKMRPGTRGEASGLRRRLPGISDYARTLDGATPSITLAADLSRSAVRRLKQ